MSKVKVMKRESLSKWVDKVLLSSIAGKLEGKDHTLLDNFNAAELAYVLTLVAEVYSMGCRDTRESLRGIRALQKDEQ